MDQHCIDKNKNKINTYVLVFFVSLLTGIKFKIISIEAFIFIITVHIMPYLYR